jgi:regulator of sigma E protease
MKAGDKFYSFDGVYVANQDHLVELVGKSQGKECAVVVERDSQKLTFNVTPVFDSTLKRPRIGIAFAGGHYVVQRPGPTPIEQFTEVFQMLGKTVFALYHSSETGVKAKDMSGPVGILGSLAVEAKTDFRRALRFMVLVNLNLAILNLLPLPVLDGGHILMALYEIVTRRRVSVRLQEVLTMGFAVALISFMAYVTYFDITKRVPLFKALLSQDSVVDPSKSAPTPGTNPAPVPTPAR